MQFSRAFLPGGTFFEEDGMYDNKSELNLVAMRAAAADRELRSSASGYVFLAADPTLSPPDLRPTGPRGETVGLSYIVHIELSPKGLWNMERMNGVFFISSTSHAIDTCKVSIMVKPYEITFDGQKNQYNDAPELMQHWFNNVLKTYFQKLILYIRNMLLNLTMRANDYDGVSDDLPRYVIGGEMNGSGWMRKNGEFHWPRLGWFREAVFQTSFRLGSLHDTVYSSGATNEYEEYILSNISRFFSGRVGFSMLNPKISVTRGEIMHTNVTTFSLFSNENEFPERRRNSTNLMARMRRETGER